MKLRSIAEADMSIVEAKMTDPIGMLGSAAKRMFSKNQGLPNRLPRKNQDEVNYRYISPNKNATCLGCKFFEDVPDTLRNKCKIVEGAILAGAWCRLWRGEEAEIQGSTDTPSDAL